MSKSNNRKSPDVDGFAREKLDKSLKQEKKARIKAERLLKEKKHELQMAHTAFKTVAEAVESQRVQLDTILEYTLAGIILANSDMYITRANRKAIAMFNLGEDYFAELRLHDLIEDFSNVPSSMNNKINTDQMSDDSLQESVGLRCDGTVFPLEYGFVSIELDGRQQSVWIFRDITKRKHDEAKRAALENELSQAQKMEALGTLASGVAHEINTPIQYISDNLRFLQDAIADYKSLIGVYETVTGNLKLDDATASILLSVKEKAEEIDLEFLNEEAPLSVDQSLEGVKQVASIVNAIKEFSHPGEDEKCELDLNHAIETTITVTRNLWKYVADIETDLSSDLPLLECLPGDINQVILNMIVNAADAIGSAEKTSKGKITISTDVIDSQIELIISDDGCGIPRDIIDRIFDPFFTTKCVGKGTGQGLAISYTIINQKHKGTINCTSKAGLGTTFKILLPIVMSESKELEVV